MSGPDAIGFIGSNRTSNEENYLLQRLARATFGTNNIDHHRTADYTGLVTALGDRAGDSTLTMEQLYDAKAVLVIGNDPSNQNPLVAWQIRSAIRHHGGKLFIIFAGDQAGAQSNSVRSGCPWTRSRRGQLAWQAAKDDSAQDVPTKLGALKQALEAKAT